MKTNDSQRANQKCCTKWQKLQNKMEASKKNIRGHDKINT